MATIVKNLEQLVRARKNIIGSLNDKLEMGVSDGTKLIELPPLILALNKISMFDITPYYKNYGKGALDITIPKDGWLLVVGSQVGKPKWPVYKLTRNGSVIKDVKFDARNYVIEMVKVKAGDAFHMDGMAEEGHRCAVFFS